MLLVKNIQFTQHNKRKKQILKRSQRTRFNKKIVIIYHNKIRNRILIQFIKINKTTKNSRVQKQISKKNYYQQVQIFSIYQSKIIIAKILQHKTQTQYLLKKMGSQTKYLIHLIHFRRLMITVDCESGAKKFDVDFGTFRKKKQRCVSDSMY
ncbi:Hypothetical_protein [Hexamita inflata]|uniref:Hypothetical_protein n=1 Tax=Hexamita inflata TaxID=28002 RepID=A0AA86UAN7_9EUKA|nr:Hypothetical protein HINF_LOCUS32866 [Hexamita inflata]